MLGSPKATAEDLAAVNNIQVWTRQRFRLAPDAAVLVCEVTCRLPLCPPKETAIAYWSADEKRHQFRLYKPMRQVRYEDIGWLFASPESHDGSAWECC